MCKIVENGVQDDEDQCDENSDASTVLVQQEEEAEDLDVSMLF